ncbi:sugar ABC transporter substrate-binding protein [Mycolicibacterium sp.]|uniref:sugar ABC transporter substrate-binding protein n=2 Tax=Mycolicibacterium sp. TaxID=2320850 RepID=UPI003D14EF74
MLTRWNNLRGRRCRASSIGAITAAAVVLVAGCTTGGATTPGGASAEAVQLESMAPVTTFHGPTEPFRPVAGKHIMILACGNLGRACIRLADGAKEAVESMGWTADVVDGRLDPTVWNRAVKQAVDSGVDGVIDVSGDPNLMGEAMAAVHAKDVPFVMMMQTPKPGDLPGVDSWVRPDAVKGGNDVGTWIAGDSGGQGSVLVIDAPEYADIMMRNDSLVDTLGEQCPGCTVHRVSISAQTMGTTLAPTVTSQLQQNPDVTYVWSPDDAYSNFVAQGIQQAGKTTGIKLVSGAGEPEAFDRIKNGSQAADLATPNNYAGWLAADTLARVISGQPVQELWDVPQRFFTSANVGDGDFTSGWDVEFDYKTVFKELWGVGQ